MKNLILAAIAMLLLSSCGDNSSKINRSDSTNSSQSYDTATFDTVETSTERPPTGNEISLDSLVSTSDTLATNDSTRLEDTVAIRVDSAAAARRGDRVILHPRRDIKVRSRSRNYPYSRDSIRLPDTIAHRMDSATVAPIRDTVIGSSGTSVKARSGVLGYSYFKSMRQNETRNINAYVTIINSSTWVIDTLKEITSEILPERKSDTSSIFTENIVLFKSLNIDLLDPNSDFVIKPVHENSRQVIDSLAGNFWTWAITPKTNKAKSRLILRVVAERPDGSQQVFRAKEIPINISLDRGLLRTVYLWLYNNPEKTLVLILIPLAALFWRKITGLFGRKHAA